MTENLKPCGNMFHFFRAEQERLEAEINSGIIRRIFYSDRQYSVQYTVSNGTDSTQDGDLTVLLSKHKNVFWWRSDTDRKTGTSLGKCIGTIVLRADDGHTELCLVREPEMDDVPPAVTKLVHDYHTGRSRMNMQFKEADSYSIENHKPEED